MKTTLLTIIILLLLLLNGYQFWTCKDCPQETITKYRTDTITIIQQYPPIDLDIPDPIPTTITVTQTDTIYLPGDTTILEIRDTIYDEIVNIYRDTIILKDRSLSGAEPSIMYEHMVRGELLASNIQLTVPHTTINSTNRTYIREYQHQLFGTSGVVTNQQFFDVALGLQYIHLDKGIHYQYAVGQQIHSFTFSHRFLRR